MIWHTHPTRFLCRAVIACLLSACVAIPCAVAQQTGASSGIAKSQEIVNGLVDNSNSETNTSSSGKPFAIQKIYVEQKSLAEFAAKSGVRMLPIKHKELNRLLQNATAKHADLEGIPPRIEAASYSSRFSKEGYMNGFVDFEIKYFGKQTSFITLSPNSLHVESLNWLSLEGERTDAVWGSIKQPNSKDLTQAAIVKKSGLLRGTWTMGGKRDARGNYTFNLVLPACGTKRFELVVPNGYRPEVEQGSLIKSEASSPGETVYDFALSGERSCKLFIESLEKNQHLSPDMDVQQRTLFDVSERGVNVTVDFKLNLQDAKPSLLQLKCPKGLRVVEVLLDGKKVNWETSTSAQLKEAEALGATVINIPIPPEYKSKSPSITVQGITPLVVGSAWKLPCPRIVDAETMRSSIDVCLSKDFAVRNIVTEFATHIPPTKKSKSRRENLLSCIFRTE